MSTDIDPTDFFNIDNVGSEAEAEVGQAVTPPATNTYAGFESHLNLPIGSTQEALDASKQLIADTKRLRAEANAVKFDEMSFDDINGEEINDDLLRNDRARIRKEAHELYAMGKSMLMYMYDQVKTCVNPNDKMWTSVANMINSVTNSLNQLNKMTKDLREENDKDVEKRILNGELSTDSDEQEYDFTPAKANKLIDFWTKENEAKIQEEIKAMADSREGAPPQIEHKD